MTSKNFKNQYQSKTNKYNNILTINRRIEHSLLYYSVNMAFTRMINLKHTVSKDKIKIK